MGTIIKTANFREGAGKEFEVISSLKKNLIIFIVSSETENDFYNIIDIKTNKEGYVHKSCVKLGPAIKENEEGVFTLDEESMNYDPEVEVYNSTDLPMTLKCNETVYEFDARETKKITLTPGSIKYRASAPGVIPYIGIDKLKPNYNYSWKFYIETRRK
ncbi:SH3 domain-containing protein [Chitinophagaceae bacterium 26-R-25]|nr:SH3 domain-containing protein [Chitinophagaceae bacterium 26-R-25]